jgi:hypothetical protein
VRALSHVALLAATFNAPLAVNVHLVIVAEVDNKEACIATASAVAASAGGGPREAARVSTSKGGRGARVETGNNEDLEVTDALPSTAIAARGSGCPEPCISSIRRTSIGVERGLEQQQVLPRTRRARTRRRKARQGRRNRRRQGAEGDAALHLDVALAPMARGHGRGNGGYVPCGSSPHLPCRCR